MSSRAHDVLARHEATGAGDDRRIARLLSALAEAPDHASAASFLLNELCSLAGDAPGVLLRYAGPEDALVFVEQVGFSGEDARDLPGTLEDHSHPLFVSATSLMPAVLDVRLTAGGNLANAREARFGPIDSWTALPLPQPHLPPTLCDLTEI